MLAVVHGKGASLQRSASAATRVICLARRLRVLRYVQCARFRGDVNCSCGSGLGCLIYIALVCWPRIQVNQDCADMIRILPDLSGSGSYRKGKRAVLWLYSLLPFFKGAAGENRALCHGIRGLEGGGTSKWNQRPISGSDHYCEG